MEGKVFTYTHFNGQVAAMVKVSTLTDFAARTDEFTVFGKDLAMQVAMVNPETVDELLSSSFIKDEGLLVQNIVDRIASTLGEVVRIEDFKRFSIK